MLAKLRLLFLLSTVFALAELGFAAEVPHSRKVIHESRTSVPNGWKRVSKVPGDQNLQLKIGLTQQNLHNADAYLMDVSDPKSKNFGKHWTAQQVADTFKPADVTVKAVNNWLVNAGFTQEQLSGGNSGWVNVNTTFAEAEALLDAEYHMYEHTGTGALQVATSSYTLPSHLSRDHIDFVLPSVHFDGLLGGGGAHYTMDKQTKKGHGRTKGVAKTRGKGKAKHAA